MSEARALTMAFTTFVLFQFFNILNARSDRQSVFTRFTFTNGPLWLSLAVVALLQVGVTHVGFMQSLFDTMSISATQCSPHSLSGRTKESASCASASCWTTS